MKIEARGVLGKRLEPNLQDDTSKRRSPVSPSRKLADRSDIVR